MISHFLRSERLVRIGGMRIMGLQLGGRNYTVSPITLFRWVSLYGLFELGELDAEKTDALYMSMSLTLKKVFLPLMVEEHINDKDFRKCSESQAYSAFKAFCEVNDVPYILEKYKSNKTDADEKKNLEDIAVEMAQLMQWQKMPEDFLRMPVQYFFALFDSLKKIDNIRNDRDPEAEPLTEAEKNRLLNKLQSCGIGVN